MQIPGHMSVAYLLGYRQADQLTPHRHLRRVLGPAVLGALVPDLIDKTLLLLDFSPHGRTVGHSVLVWGALTALVTLALWPAGCLWRADCAARWLLAGAWSHMIADMANDLVAGLLHTRYLSTSWAMWPLMTPDDAALILPGVPFPCSRCKAELEMLTILLVITLIWRRARAPRPETVAALGQAGAP